MSQPVQPNQQQSLYDALEPILTATRLAPYLAAAHGNRKRALQLYQWNIELSGAVYEALHVFEVVLRNTLDAQLCVWNAAQTDQSTQLLHNSEWLQDPAPLLKRLVRSSDLANAQARAARAVWKRERLVGHADLLAQLTFGTWRFLLPDNPGRQFLWDNALHRAFPHLQHTTKQLVGFVDGVYQLRNRAAHLEPLLSMENVRNQFTNIRTVLAAIDPVAEQWFVSTQRVTSLLKARP